MPIKKSRLLTHRKEAVIQIDEDTLTIGYNARGLSWKFFQELPKNSTNGSANAEADSDANAVSLMLQLEGLLLDWDMTDDDGRPLPITMDVLHEIDIRILQEIYVKVSEGLTPSPNGTRSESSASISSTAGDGALVPSGSP